jgi:hypothetical protein
MVLDWRDAQPHQAAELVAAHTRARPLVEAVMGYRYLGRIGAPTASLWLFWLGSLCLSVALHGQNEPLSRLALSLSWIAWTLANFAPKDPAHDR